MTLTSLAYEEMSRCWADWRFMADRRDDYQGARMYTRVHAFPAFARDDKYADLGWLAYKGAAIVRELTQGEAVTPRWPLHLSFSADGGGS
jgi:hypothetical protein